jgi:hypothetical protein
LTGQDNGNGSSHSWAGSRRTAPAWQVPVGDNGPAQRSATRSRRVALPSLRLLADSSSSRSKRLVEEVPAGRGCGGAAGRAHRIHFRRPDWLDQPRLASGCVLQPSGGSLRPYPAGSPTPDRVLVPGAGPECRARAAAADPISASAPAESPQRGRPGRGSRPAGVLRPGQAAESSGLAPARPAPHPQGRQEERAEEDDNADD